MLSILKDSGGQDKRQRVVANVVKLRGRSQIVCSLDLELYFICVEIPLEG